MSFMKKNTLLFAVALIISVLQLCVFGAPSAVEVSDSVLETAQEYAAIFSESTVEIDIGERQALTNIRYAEINGVQTKISESNNKYNVSLSDNNMIVEITEKTSADASAVVKTQYFFIDVVNKSAKKLDADTFVQTYEEKSIRTVGKTGVRFKAHMLTSAKLETTDYVVDEYGYIVALESNLKGQDLTLSSPNYIRGVGYNREDGLDIVFDSTNDEFDVFTLVINNVPLRHYDKTMVCKTYTKLCVQGRQYVVYSEPMTGSFIEVAGNVFRNNPENIQLAKIIFEYASYVSEDASFENSSVISKINGSSVSVSGTFATTSSAGAEYNIYVATYNQDGAMITVKKSDDFTAVSGRNSFSADFSLETDEVQVQAFVLTTDMKLVGKDKKIIWNITDKEFYNTIASNSFTSSTDFSQYFDSDNDITVIESIALISNLHAKYNKTQVKERENVTYETTFEMDDADIFVDLSERNSVNLTGISLSRATGGLDETNGYLYGQSDVSDGRQDPQVLLNGLNLDSRKYNKITLRMKLELVPGGNTELVSKGLQIYYKTNANSSFDETKSFVYSYRNVPNIYDWFEIELDLTDKRIWRDSSVTSASPETSGSLWNNVITGIRVDPFNANGKFYIDYVKFSQSENAKAPDWHDVYVDYALDNKLIKLGQYLTSDYSKPITRKDFFFMLISAFPEGEFKIINKIVSLPDIEKNEKYAELYLLMYNSGITLGFDKDGNIGLDSYMTRSQFAAIANRLLVPANRLRGTVNANWNDDAYQHDIEYNDDSDINKFANRSRMSDVVVSDGCLSFTAGYDSYMYDNSVLINADEYTKIKVRIKADFDMDKELLPESYTLSDIYFMPDDYIAPITNYHSNIYVTDYYLDPLGWYVFEIDLSLHTEWNGMVNYFRFDPMNASGKYKIDYIRFIKSPYADLPDQQSLIDAGYSATDIMPDGFKNGFLVSTGSNTDTFAGMYEKGKKITFPESTGEPLWTLGCWYNGAGTEDFPVIDAWEHRDETTGIYTFADTYGINTVTYNPELDSMTQRLNATKIYNGKPHNNAEYKWWPHQLFNINENFVATVDKEVCSADADRMFVEMDIRMLDFKNTPIPGHSVENMNVCSYLAYFYLRVKDTPSQKIWFGMSLFGTTGSQNLVASKRVHPGWSPDSAAHQYMYGIPAAVVYDGIENSFNPAPGVADVGEEWKHIRLDVTSHIDRAVEWANRDNIFEKEVTKSDMYFEGLNIGYEVHGNYDATFEIKNIRMISYNKD